MQNNWCLLFQSVEVNRPGIIAEGEQYIISCIAQGSSRMTFGWYKDGIFVNVTKATRQVLLTTLWLVRVSYSNLYSDYTWLRGQLDTLIP